MPQLVGAWLAGVYDNDKAVSRAAQDSLKHVFPSEEKFKTVWLVYQVDILRSAQDIIEKETTNTLSDERTTSPDDALSKYTRTLGAAVMTITNLIGLIHFLLANLQKLINYRDYPTNRFGQKPSSTRTYNSWSSDLETCIVI